MSAGRPAHGWEDDERRARREHALRLVRRGASVSDVAREFGVTPDTLRKWMERYGDGKADR